MKEFKGDYMGFTYNNVHSSDLGIVRTSNGSRFEENLLPTIQDKTVQVPGGDGTYYFGSYYTQKPLNISFAFDALTEAQLELLRAHFGDKKIHDLVFDERPYKAYRAKVTGTATIKYIPFNEGEGRERVYKGEGTIQFTCYDPYAICKKKYLDEYSDPNKIEWAGASGLLETQGDYDKLRKLSDHWGVQLYNPGVKEADCKIALLVDDCCGYILRNGDNGIALNWDTIPKGSYLIVDSKTNLAENAVQTGDKKFTTLGAIYNDCITSGDFFKIPKGESYLSVEKIAKDGSIIDPAENDVIVLYNYYYF